MKNLLVFILILPMTGLSQTMNDNYSRLISEAYQFKGNQNYKEAIKKFKSAFKILIPNSSTPLFELAECGLMLGNEKLADKWIRKGISLGGGQMDYLKKFEGFGEIQNKLFYQKIILDYNSLRQKYFSTMENIDVYLELNELVARDQFVRKIDDYINDITDKDKELAMQSLRKASIEKDTIAVRRYEQILFPKPDEEFEILQIRLMRKIDSLNIERLIEITSVYGWQERAWVILWHQRGNHDEDNYIWDYFRPLINKEIEDGKINRSFWWPFNEYKKWLKAKQNRGLR